MVFCGESLHKGRRAARLIGSDMKKRKPNKSKKLEEPKKWSWFEFINDESEKLTIPVGSPFQANIPDWTSQSRKQRSTSQSSDARWLGTQVWPNKPRGEDSIDSEIGKGRPSSCECAAPGSVECVNHHVAYKKVRLQLHLGIAFKKWKFDEMGEDVSKSWNGVEQKKFNSVVRRYPSWDKEKFLQLVLKRFPSRSKEEIVKYYFNVFVPRRMRAGCKIIDSSSDGVPSDAPRLKIPPQKRSQPENCALSDSNDVQSKYLKVQKMMQAPRKHRKPINE